VTNTAETCEKCEEVKLGFFEKYLAVWVFLCMVIGLLLSQFIPQLSLAINDLQFAGISIPIGVCLFLMLYPALLNLQFSELKKTGEKPETNHLNTDFQLGLGTHNNGFAGILLPRRQRPANSSPNTARL
jgi:hypothetical protein